MKILEESDLIKNFLTGDHKYKDNPIMIQIGANEGRYEYAKQDGKDFVFEFLLENNYWTAILVEPIPATFQKLKSNYCNHHNSISFMNCAITEKIEKRVLYINGKDGKSSSLLEFQKKESTEKIEVQCINYDLLCNISGISKVDFIKIDAEGYDEIIIEHILCTPQKNTIPKIIFWEKVYNKQSNCEEILKSLDYEVFMTGLNKLNHYMDRVAIHQSLLSLPEKSGHTHE